MTKEFKTTVNTAKAELSILNARASEYKECIEFFESAIALIEEKIDFILDHRDVLTHKEATKVDELLSKYESTNAAYSKAVAEESDILKAIRALEMRLAWLV